MNQQVRNVDQRCCSFETPQAEGLMSFGGVHFGDAKRGDARRTNRLVEVADSPQIAFVSPRGHAAEVQIFAHALVQRPVEIRRVRESSFGLWSLSRRLNLSVPGCTPTVY